MGASTSLTEEQFQRVRNRLGSISRELGATSLRAWASSARARASTMTCANDRQRACELKKLADLADGLSDVVAEFEAVGSAG